MNIFIYDLNIDMNQPKDLVIQPNQKEWRQDDRAKVRKLNSCQWFMWIVIFMISITLVGCESSPAQNEPTQQISGIVTQVETGKDGVQVELETESELYNITISAVQAEIKGDFDQIKIGAEIEVTGRINDGMEPPLMVAEQVTVLRNSEPYVVDPLQDKTWELTSYNDTQPIVDHHPTLNFFGDQVSGTTGCNHYGGMVQIDEDSIRFDGVFSTEMACLEPDGLMEQERIFLDLLRTADQFELDESALTFYAESNSILVFEIQSAEPVSIEPTLEPENPVVVEVDPSPTSPPVFTPPEGWNPYRDPLTSISVYIPDGWIVTGIIEGEYAILQSYPEDKYVGGEGREDGDTKCDLSIRPEGDRVEDLIEQWKSNDMTTIVTEEEFIFQSGLSGRRFVIDSMGRATVFITEINQRVILLTCFGDFTHVDDIATTINIPE